MKKLVIVLACMLISLSLFSGCTDNKDNNNSGTDLDNAVDIDVDVDAEPKSDTDISIDDDIVFDFKDPENADGIVVTPKNNKTE